MTISRAFVVIATLFLAAAPFEAAPARADTLFDFSGICDAGCTGTATGVLTLVDFFDDDNGMVDDATFISFAYSSSSGSFLITLADGGSAAGFCTTTVDPSGDWLFRHPRVFPPSKRPRRNSTRPRAAAPARMMSALHSPSFRSAARFLNRPTGR